MLVVKILVGWCSLSVASTAAFHVWLTRFGHPPYREQDEYTTAA